jgi:hypothetical protein
MARENNSLAADWGQFGGRLAVKDQVLQADELTSEQSRRRMSIRRSSVL